MRRCSEKCDHPEVNIAAWSPIARNSACPTAILTGFFSIDYPRDTLTLRPIWSPIFRGTSNTRMTTLHMDIEYNLLDTSPTMQNHTLPNWQYNLVIIFYSIYRCCYYSNSLLCVCSNFVMKIIQSTNKKNDNVASSHRTTRWNFEVVTTNKTVFWIL